MGRTVVITLTENEYASAVIEAEKMGLQLSQYVKRFPIGSEEFEDRFEELKQKAQNFEVGKRYSIIDCFSDDWQAISRGTRLSLGRNFYNFVRSGGLENVIEDGKKGNVQMYLRTN